MAYQPNATPSIDAWLQSERGNANMARAIEDYERAKSPDASQPAQPQPQPIPRYAAGETPATVKPAPGQPGGVLPPENVDQNGQRSTQAPGTYNPQKVISAVGADQERAPSKYFISAGLGGSYLLNAGFTNSFNSEGDLTSEIPGLYLSVGAGHNYSPNLSGEISFSYQSADATKLRVKNGITGTTSSATATGTTRIPAVMLNGRYAFPMSKWISPYAEIGVGAAALMEDSVVASGAGTADFSAIGFAYQAGFGVSMPMSETTQLDVGYRFFSIPKSWSVDNNIDDVDAVYSHTLMAGLRYNF